MEKKTMQDFRKQEDERSREHWAFVESVANKVGNWPMWKQAATLTASQCKPLRNFALEILLDIHR